MINGDILINNVHIKYFGYFIGAVGVCIKTIVQKTVGLIGLKYAL